MNKKMIVFAFLFLAACGPLLPHGPEAARIFGLSAQIDNSKTPLPVTVQVQQPTAAPGLDTDRIALKKSAHEFDYYAGAKWAGTLPDVVQDTTINAFNRAGIVKTIGADTLTFAASHRLAIDITDFQAEYLTDNKNAAPIARVRLVIRLIANTTGAIIATENLEETVPAASNTLQDVIAAENQAFDRVLERMAVRMQDRFGPAKPVKNIKK